MRQFRRWLNILLAKRWRQHCFVSPFYTLFQSVLSSLLGRVQRTAVASIVDTGGHWPHWYCCCYRFPVKLTVHLINRYRHNAIAYFNCKLARFHVLPSSLLPLDAGTFTDGHRADGSSHLFAHFPKIRFPQVDNLCKDSDLRSPLPPQRIANHGDKAGSTESGSRLNVSWLAEFWG